MFSNRESERLKNMKKRVKTQSSTSGYGSLINDLSIPMSSHQRLVRKRAFYSHRQKKMALEIYNWS